MFARLTLAGVLIVALGLAGCSGAESSTETSDGAGTSEGTGVSESDVIVLEDGWAIQDVITPEEVGAIMGATLIYFPEAASAAQDLSLIHISEPTRLKTRSRMPSSA